MNFRSSVVSSTDIAHTSMFSEPQYTVTSDHSFRSSYFINSPQETIGCSLSWLLRNFGILEVNYMGLVEYQNISVIVHESGRYSG
jgi:hypothetical protein